MTRDQRYRLVYKPLAFTACLVPFLWAAGGVLAASRIMLPASIPVPELGADPQRRVLGIVGKSTLNLLLITLAVTPLRQLSGNANLLRFRRMLGLFAFFYATLHFAMYVVIDRRLDWSTLGEDLMKRPWITLGFLGFVLLVPLAATSTRAAMRRLGRGWQRLHYLVYPATVLGCWHFYWQVKRDVREPLLYAGMLAVLLGYRVARRTWAAKRITSKSGSATAPERT